MHLFRINSIKSVIWRKTLPVFVGSLLFIVFCGSAWAISLKFKLEMLGYNEEEIAAIVSRNKSRAEVDRKIRMEMLCLSVPKPLMPSGRQNRKAKSSKWVKHNLKAVRLTLPVSHKDYNPKGLDILGRARPYFSLIKDIAAKTDVEKSLIMAVIKTESDFDPKAVSPKGAMGLMQLMPSTAKDLGVSDPFDPKENIHGGARYLYTCLKTFNNVELALAAYNAGPKRVAALRKIPPYPETENFVKKVSYYKNLYDHMLLKLK